MYSLFCFFFNCDGSERALDLTSCGGGRLAFLSLLTREADETGLLLEDVLGEGFVGAIFVSLRHWVYARIALVEGRKRKREVVTL